MSADGQAPAFVLGDIDLERPLALAGIDSVVVSGPRDPVRFSRGTTAALDLPEDWRDGPELAERLVAAAEAYPGRPVLFYQAEAHLIYVSRHRERLAEAFEFVLPAAGQVDALVDKARWQPLAEELGLPIPKGRHLSPAAADPDVDLRFPLVLKPLDRRSLPRTGFLGKAIRVDSEAALRSLWPSLRDAGVELFAQELIVGPESRIESHHAYVDSSGRVAAEFTGRKVRTYPAEYGDTTALVTTDAPDVAEAGREVLRKLELRGVAKVDFKRAPDGRLWLLEVNPRFTLWFHVGAVAGVNVPALVYADLTGSPRPPAGQARPGVRWCNVMDDRWVRREAGLSWPAWLRSTVSSETRHGLARDDPMPFLRGVLWRRLRDKLS